MKNLNPPLVVWILSFLFAISVLDHFKLTTIMGLSLYGIIAAPPMLLLLGSLLIKKNSIQFYKNQIYQFIIIWFIWVFISTLFAERLNPSLVQLVLIFRTIVISLIVSIAMQYCWKTEYNRLLESYLVFFYIFICFSTITDYNGLTNFSGIFGLDVSFKRAGILGGGPVGSTTVSFFLSFIFLTLYRSIIKGNILLIIINMFLILAGFISVFYTASRTGMLCFIVVTVLYYFYIMNRIKLSNKIIIYFISFLLVFIFIIYLNFSGNILKNETRNFISLISNDLTQYDLKELLFEPSLNIEEFSMKYHSIHFDSSAKQRIGLLMISLQRFFEFPILGYSADSLSGFMHHNTFFGMFAETGFLGGLFYILIFVKVYQAFSKACIHLEDQAFWFSMKCCVISIVITLLTMDYLVLKRFWMFCIPFAYYANREMIIFKRKKIAGTTG